MKIVRTFVEGLTSFKYSKNSPDELTRLLDEWNDLEYLEQFFEDNKVGLSSFCSFKNIPELSVEQAVIKTRKDVTELTDRLISLSSEKSDRFDSLFENLNNNHYKLKPLEKQKAKESWLRLYAIRIDPNCYVITGGAIKLTHRMQDSHHTQEELNKLEKCKTFLQEQGVFDEDSFEEFLEIEL